MNCYQSEQYLHKKYLDFCYIPEIYFVGCSECYYLDVLKLDSLYKYELNNYS